MSAREIEIVHVDGDDWQGLYFNGELQCEGHTLSVREVLRHVVGAQVVGYHVVFPDEDWLMDMGTLPDHLHEVMLGES